MTSLIDESTQTALWHRLIDEAQHRAECQLEEMLESYLVFVLMRHVDDRELGHRLMALEYLLRQQDVGTGRRDGLRDVGDQCLLIAGLFPERARRRRVPVRYFIDLGSTAYQDLSDAMRAGIAELYGRLAEGFEDLVRVLLAARAAERMPVMAEDWARDPASRMH